MRKKLLGLLGVIMVLALVLTACEPAVKEPPAVEEPPVVEKPVEVEEPEPEPEPEPLDLSDYVDMAVEAAEAAAASSEAAADAAAQAAVDAATVADLVAGYEPVEYPEVTLVETPFVPEGDLAAFPAQPNSGRKGSWPDEVLLIEEPSTDSGIARLEAGDIDVYAYTISEPEPAEKIRSLSDIIDFAESSGSYNELTFNVAKFADGRLNPFSNAKIREAMNWLVDRQYLVDELLAAGSPRVTCFNTYASDTALLAAEIRALDVKYAYNLELADETVAAEMEAMGAERVDGVWSYNGDPIEIHALIRIEDERHDIGDYFSNQLEEIGFKVFRDYKAAADASPLWVQSNPADGLWSFYTGGWITTAVPRSLVDNFAFFYTPMGLPWPLWLAYENDPEFYAIAEKLDAGDYDTLEERKELAAEALELSLKESQRIFLYDQGSIAPKLKNIKVGADLYGSISGSYIWPTTLHRVGDDGKPEQGGQIKIAQPSLFSEPWNPIAGTNWIYDMTPIRGAGQLALVFDPFTGLLWPQRAERAELVLQEGTPMNLSLDWVKMSYADEIVVPGDVWADWDAEAQVFVTVAEKYSALLEALPDVAAAAVAAAEAAAADAAAAADDAAAAADDAAAATELDVAEAAADAANEAADVAEDAESSALGAAKRAAGSVANFDNYSSILADGLKSRRLSRIYYPADLYTSVKWHDGSPFSFGDVLIGMILTFDRAKEASPIFDASYVPEFDSFMSTFKGVKVVSTNPLTIETYADSLQPDAENTISTWWPYYNQGEGAWHNLYLGMLAEEAGDASFSSDKVEVIEGEWLNYVAGETLEMMAKHFDDDLTLPYEPTFSQFVTADELQSRMENLKAFYEAYGHLWVGTGALYIKEAHPIEKQLLMARFEDYPDDAARWLGFSEAKMAEVDVDGEGMITIGDEAVFKVTVTFEGDPYPTKDLKEVIFLVLDATNAVALQGNAVAESDGNWVVKLTPEDTAALAPGSNSLEVVVVSNLVAVPSAGSFTFVTVP